VRAGARSRALKGARAQARKRAVSAGQEEGDTEDEDDDGDDDDDAAAADNEEDDDEGDDVEGNDTDNAADDDDDEDVRSPAPRRRGPAKKKSKKQQAHENDIAAAAAAVAARTDELDARKKKVEKVKKAKAKKWPLAHGIITTMDANGDRVHKCAVCRKTLTVRAGSNSKVREHYNIKHGVLYEQLNTLQASGAGQTALANAVAAARPKPATTATATGASTTAAPTAAVKATSSAAVSGARALVDLTSPTPTARVATRLTDYYIAIPPNQDKVVAGRAGGAGR
jgi:hypothetical protein